MASLPNEDECASYSQCEAIDYIEKLILEIDSAFSRDDKESLKNFLLRISTSYFDYYTSFEDVIIECLIKNSFVSISSNLLKKYGNLKDDDVISDLLTAIINFSDYSPEFAREIANSDGIKWIIDQILTWKSDEKCESLINWLTIVNNSTRHPNCTVVYRIDELKLLLASFVNDKNDNNSIAVLSMLILSYVINDSEKDALSIGEKVVQNLIQKLQRTNNEDRRCQGFSAQEILNGLRSISANDLMKNAIAENGGIEAILSILNDNKEVPESEVEFALETVLQLSFVGSIRDSLVGKYGICSILKPFENHPSEKILKICESVKWNILDKQTTVTGDEKKLKTDRIHFDVFMSYSQKNTDVILNIYKCLKDRKFKIWIDREQMINSTLDAMAKGIENSSIVIIAMSESYRRSANCRLEAEYAMKLQKRIVPLIMEFKYRPSGWLGIILGTKLYFEFSERRDPKTNMEELIRSMQSESVDVEFHKESGSSLSSERHSQAASKTTEYIKQWDKARVTQWLRENQFTSLTKAFSTVDGRMLSTILQLRITSPEYFNKTFQKEFKMKFVDVVRFHRALDDLNLD